MIHVPKVGPHVWQKVILNFPFGDQSTFLKLPSRIKNGSLLILYLALAEVCNIRMLSVCIIIQVATM